jgi:AraC family transcriptional regulator
MNCAADSEDTFDSVLVAIDPGQLALAAAEESAFEARLTGCLSGYDQALLDLARALVSEGTSSYPNGPLFWNDVADRFIGGLIARHSKEPKIRVRGTLGKHVLAQFKEYVTAHLDEQIEVATLANIAGRSPFHFTRVFARSVGVTPHRYVVHLRLQRATELVREGRFGLTKIAATIGFADQSHLSRWVRRVHGVALSQLSAA